MHYKKLNASLKEQLRKAALLLRFREEKPTLTSKRYCSYAKIAHFLNLHPYEIQHICRSALKPQKSFTFDQEVKLLEQVHIDFLLDQRTLERWSGLTMKERTVMFHRQFPDKRIAVTSLRRLYLKNKIKRKKLRQEKVMPPEQKLEYAESCREVLAQLEQAKAEKRLTLYLDEVNFTKLSLMKREWSTRNSNLTVDQVDVYQGYRSVIAAISEENGVDHSAIHQ